MGRHSASQGRALVAVAILVLLCAAQVSEAKDSNRPTKAKDNTPTKSPTAAPTLAPTSGSTASRPLGGSASSPTGSPSASPTSSPTGGGGGGGMAPGKWNPLPLPKGEKCEPPEKGKPAESRGYPGSPFKMDPFVFKNDFKPLYKLEPKFEFCEKGLCMDAYNITIEEFMADFNFTGTQCAGAKIPMLGYNKMSPGPLMVGQQGVQDLVRFTNLVSPTSKNFPPAGPGNAGHGEKDICKSRPERVNGTTAGTGRGFSTHHHGMASLSSFDGWADQYFCHGETKDYVLPNNRHATQFYHDHAIGITSENTYAGLVGMRLTRPCTSDDPFGVEALQEHQVMLGDFALGTDCRRIYRRQDEHKDNLFGDVNTVNGVPWPVLRINAKHHRFRVLNAAVSRPYILQVRDDYGNEVGSDLCRIVGADGGNLPRSVPLPPNGLMTDVAYRWDIVCDFSGHSGRTLYLYNQPDKDRTTSETPFFCFSHLVMKIVVGAPEAAAPKPSLFNETRLARNVAIPSATLTELTNRALSGDTDRTLDFGRSSGLWTLNGRGWDTNDNLGEGHHIDFDDVGQNNIELWTLKSGGGWIHPVHIHLIDFFPIAIKGSGGGWRPVPPDLLHVPKDVLHIGSDVREVTVVARYGPHVGEYMMHCHNGVHEDSDMLRAFLVVDPEKGLTFSRTPAFNHSLLAGTPLDPLDAKGSSQTTTYTPATIGRYPLDKTYVKKLLAQQYYHIFYPPPKLPSGAPNPLADPNLNMWITTCGVGQPDTDPAPLPPVDPDEEGSGGDGGDGGDGGSGGGDGGDGTADQQNIIGR